MNRIQYTVVALAVATLGLSHFAEARDHTRGDAGPQRGFTETRAQPRGLGDRMDLRQHDRRPEARGGSAGHRMDRASHHRYDGDRGHPSLRHSARNDHRGGGHRDFHPRRDHKRDPRGGRFSGGWW